MTDAVVQMAEEQARREALDELRAIIADADQDTNVRISAAHVILQATNAPVQYNMQVADTRE